MIQPARKSDVIATDLNKMVELLNAGQKNDVLLQKIKNEIKKLMPIDSVSCHRLSGIICGVEGDKVGVKYHFEEVLTAIPNNPNRLRDYAAALYNVGLPFDALDYARRAYQIQKEPDILRLLIEITGFVARFEETSNYLLELKKMKIDTEIEEKAVDLEIIEFMKRHDLHDDEVSFIRKLADQVVIENELSISKINSQVLYEGDEEWLSMDIYVDSGNAKETVRLNEQFFGYLIDAFPCGSHSMDLITCGFEST